MEVMVATAGKAVSTTVTTTSGRIATNKQLSKLPLILLCTIRIDDSLFDCRVLPQQESDGVTGLGTGVPDPFESVWNDLSLSKKPITG